LVSYFDLKMGILETSNIQRYTNIRLPSYRYIPGQKLSHSESQINNHLPRLPEPFIEFSEQNWKTSERYLYAIDLFNLEYYWEVHEVLEILWMATGKMTPTAIFIQGLIQLSVAMLKKKQLNSIGANRLSNKALPKLLSQKGTFLGIDVEKLIEEFKFFIEKQDCPPPQIILQSD
jgi:hypothetical protein